MMSKDMQGIITYMYMENFVTYDKVEVKPDRHLNVIIGPNGTGKSTIVCAIVLGLGGKPSTIGRAIHIKEYVKAGCEEATIIIHLKSNKNKDIVVKRLFNIQGKTVWYLNDNITNNDAITKLTASMNIQVDNLCQFLPQDKVQEFSKMNPQQLLENTEKSVADPEVLECHKKLIELRGSHKNIDADIANKQKLLEVKTQIFNGLKDTVNNVKERKVIKKKIVALKQKKAWMLYDQTRRDLLKLNNERQKLVQTVTSLQKEASPINDAIKRIDKEIGILNNAMTTNKNKVESEKQKLEKLLDNIEACQLSIQECGNICKQRLQVEKARDEDISLEKQRREKHENDLANIKLELGSDETLSRRKQELTDAIDEQRKVINALVTKSCTAKQEVDKVEINIRSLEADMQLLNIESKRMQILRERSRDTYKATLWLRENRDKFSGTIHEPMFLTMNIKNAAYAKYFENIISFKDLVAFVCEQKQDMNLLMRYLRNEQKLQVNVIHSDPESHVSLEPNTPLDHLRQLGFTHYLISLLEAPIAIMKYLASMYHLNNIPIGTQAVDSNADRIPAHFQCYMSAESIYNVRVSKYSKDRSTRIRYLTKSGVLSIVVDKAKLQRIENEIAHLQEEKIRLTCQARKCEEEIIEENKKLDKYRADRNTIQQDVQQIEVLKVRINLSTRKIEEFEKGRTSVEKIKEASQKQIDVHIKTVLGLYNKFNKSLEDLLTCEAEHRRTNLTLEVKRRALSLKTIESQDLKEKLKTAEERLHRMNMDIKPLKDEVKKLYDDALETTGGINPNDKDFAAINNTFQKLPPTMEEILSELHIAKAKVYCMGYDDAESENILRDYDQVKADIASLEEFIAKNTARLGSAENEMEVLRQKWLTPLRGIVNKINQNFSTHFSAMNCAGEVNLHVGENELDFEQYGLKIKVKFREADQLQELTRHHQSGGERAVTTAIYMIALQELSRVPFRCVDEINQGMDATNERRVFNLLVKITARTNSSQYFFLTPKLLPDLQYDETVTVHCVFNGPFVISHTEFDVEEYCKHIKKVQRLFLFPILPFFLLLSFWPGESAAL